MNLRRKLSSSLLVIVVSTSIIITAHAGSFRKEGWSVPNVSGAVLVEKQFVDAISELPGRETLHRSYRRPDGTYFASLDVEGRRYGYYLDTDGRAPMEFLILDYQGDGTFEYRMDIAKEGSLAPTPCFLLYNEPMSVRR